MSQFNICIFPTNKDIFHHAFDEVAMALFYGLQALGHDVVMRDYYLHADRINIVFGAHNYDPNRHPNFSNHRVVIFNCVQLDKHNTQTDVNPSYFELMSSHPVWDCSQNNVQTLLQSGVKAQFVEISYAPEMTRIEKLPDEFKYDVLFYGTVLGSERCNQILVQLEDAGLKLKVLTSTYGRQRDLLISQSKLVIKIGYDDESLLEMARLAYLLNNDIAIVSEITDRSYVDEGFKHALQPVSFDHLVKECVRLCADETARQQRIQAASAYFKAPERSMAARLAQILPELCTATGWEISSPPHTVLSAVQRSERTHWAYPPRLNIGCGQRHVKGWVNADIDTTCLPDWVVDFSKPLPFFNEDFALGTYGRQKIIAGSFTHIQVHQVLQCIKDIVPFMKNCLDLLCDGGQLEIHVPYDLSLSAWQQPETIRAFNESSFNIYCDGYRSLGWDHYRFKIIKTTFALNALGHQLELRKMPVVEIARTPRAVEHLHLNLKKILPA